MCTTCVTLLEAILRNHLRKTLVMRKDLQQPYGTGYRQGFEDGLEDLIILVEREMDKEECSLFAAS